MARSIENLSMVSGQLETALQYANGLTQNLQTTAGEAATAPAAVAQPAAAPVAVPTSDAVRNYRMQMPATGYTDKDIYKELLRFFALHEDKQSVLPEELAAVVAGRINGIRKRKSD